MNPNSSVWLNRYAKLLVFVTFLLIIAGGLVTSTKSGLSVPDWPLSYGQLMPPMVGGVRFEHSHRMIASLVGLMTLILTLWLGFREKRTWVRWLGIAAFGAVVTQGILGGMTVLFLLPAPISIFHACLAQTFLSLVVALAFFTSREWTVVPLPKVQGSPVSIQGNEPCTFGRGTGLEAPVFMTIALIYLQLILGATLRHTENHLIVISHIVTGFLVLIHSVSLMMRVFNRHEGNKALTRPALFLGLTALSQMTLGMGAFLYVFMLPQKLEPQAAKVFFITAHQSLGALLLAISVFLALRIYRRGSA